MLFSVVKAARIMYKIFASNKLQSNMIPSNKHLPHKSKCYTTQVVENEFLAEKQTRLI